MYEKLACKIRKKKTSLLDMQAPHEPKQKSRRQKMSLLANANIDTSTTRTATTKRQAICFLPCLLCSWNKCHKATKTLLFVGRRTHKFTKKDVHDEMMMMMVVVVMMIMSMLIQLMYC